MPSAGSSSYLSLWSLLVGGGAQALMLSAAHDTCAQCTCSCVCRPCISISGRVQTFFPFWASFFFFLLVCESSSSGYESFVRYIYWEYFLPVRGLPFYFLTVFWQAETFNFDKVQFMNLKILRWVLLGSHQWNLCLPQDYENILQFFSSRSFIVSVFTFRPKIDLELVLGMVLGRAC